jgi:cell wall-associated NlpC family hydrolase
LGDELTDSGGDVRDDNAVRDRLTGFCALPAVRGVAAALAIATAVTGVGTAAVTGSSSTSAGLITSVTTVAPDAAAAAVIAAARTHLGQKYVYGGDGPTTWDCSGLTSSLWSSVGGVSGIPRTAHQQQAWTTPVPASQVLPGDLYFLGTPATHVGIVLGAGMVLDASASSGKVVLRALWTATDITFGRVPRPTAVRVVGTPPTPATTTPVAPTKTAAPPVAPPVVAPPLVAPPPVLVTSAPPINAGAVVPRPSLVATDKGFVAAAKVLVGAHYQSGGVGPSYDDGALVAAAWGKAGGGLLPLDRNALAARTRPVSSAHLELGDVVVYGATNHVWHVGIYVGKGRMIDASRIKGRVVLRPVFSSPDLWFGRLH